MSSSVNKFEKKLSAIVCIGIVTYEQQVLEASSSYRKVLDRFYKALIGCKDCLPSYDSKGVAQIQRLVIDYGNKVFDPDGHSSVIYTSLMTAMVEDVQHNPHLPDNKVLTDPVRIECFEELRLSIKAMNNYWDRKTNKYAHYHKASEMFEVWKWLF